MGLNCRVHYLFILIIVLLAKIGHCQDVSFQQLEQKVYQLNNELKYNQSQALLLPVLQDELVCADDKYKVATLLSYTYKRIFDYQSALKFLTLACTFAEQTANRQQYVAAILCEEAFVYFDTHDYQKADSLMILLEKSGFRHVSLENKSKLVMQQGYLLFLNKQYEQAEATYDKAIVWMRASTPCHLPMIFVKKMQLYNAMNRLDLLGDALKQSTFYADSCKIIKYHLYAHEELRDIYKARNNLPKLAQTQIKLDSLNKIYAREENISSLHNQKETLLLTDKEQKLQREHVGKRYLVMLLAGLVMVAFALLGWLLTYRWQQRLMEARFYRMKSELEIYLASGRVTPPNSVAPAKENLPVGLSERQREVLDLMAVGMSNKMIADKLCISENTVKYHIKNIYQILEIKNRKEFLVNVNK